MDVSEIITVVVSTVAASGITGFFSWFFTRKKYKAETKAIDIENLHKSLEFYQKLSDDTTRRLDEMLERDRLLEEQVIALRAENIELNDIIKKLEEKVNELTAAINELKK